MAYQRGRPRLSTHPPRKLATRVRPELYERMDAQVASEGQGATQRAFVERAIERELADPQPKELTPHERSSGST